MATINYTMTGAWAASTRYTAAAEVDGLLVNLSAQTVYFEITQTDTAPALTDAQAVPLAPGARQAMQLASGDRLHLRGPAGAVVAWLI